VKVAQEIDEELQRQQMIHRRRRKRPKRYGEFLNLVGDTVLR